MQNQTQMQREIHIQTQIAYLITNEFTKANAHKNQNA